jgi:DNA-binding protein HU-beta
VLSLWTFGHKRKNFALARITVTTLDDDPSGWLSCCETTPEATVTSKGAGILSVALSESERCEQVVLLKTLKEIVVPPSKKAAPAKKAAPDVKVAAPAKKTAPMKKVAAPARKSAPVKAAPQVTVTLKQFATELAGIHDLSKKLAEALLGDLVRLATQHLKKGDKIRLTGLGILQVRAREARMGRNPATGEIIKIAASKKIAFRPAKELKEAV